MNFSKPRFLWEEPFLKLELLLDFKNGVYSLEFILAHFSIFGFYKIGDTGMGFDIFGFGVHSG